MVKALLDGRKSQTRRIVKVRGVDGKRYPISSPAEQLIELEAGEFSRGIFHYQSTAALSGPYKLGYAVGDLLWVRETWQTGTCGDGPKITFRATPDYFDIDAWDGPDEGIGPSFNYDRCPGARFDHWIGDVLSNDGPWRKPIHMPRWASRITLKVTGVKIERLQDISREDEIAEGTPDGQFFDSVWSSIHGHTSWEANPWVVAISFEVIRKNIGEVAG